LITLNVFTALHCFAISGAVVPQGTGDFLVLPDFVRFLSCSHYSFHGAGVPQGTGDFYTSLPSRMTFIPSYFTIIKKAHPFYRMRLLFYSLKQA
jgi:hypothetical protein